MAADRQIAQRQCKLEQYERVMNVNPASDQSQIDRQYAVNDASRTVPLAMEVT